MSSDAMTDDVTISHTTATTTNNNNNNNSSRTHSKDNSAITNISKSTNENLPWVEKYRPTDFNSLLSHNEIINTIQQLINANRLPHLLLYGPPGYYYYQTE
jgi:replication-associated recombination protein RarA